MFQDWEKWLQLIRWSFAPTHFLPENSVTQCCLPIPVTICLHPFHIQASHLHTLHCQSFHWHWGSGFASVTAQPTHCLDTSQEGLDIFTTAQTPASWDLLSPPPSLYSPSFLRERYSIFTHQRLPGTPQFLQASTLKACDSVRCTLNAVRYEGMGYSCLIESVGRVKQYGYFLNENVPNL